MFPEVSDYSFIKL